MKVIHFFTFFLIFSSIAFSQNWESVGTDINEPILGLYSDTVDNYLYASGVFHNYTNDGRLLKSIARWDGAKWDSLGNGVSAGANTFSFARFNNKLYVGGVFDSVGKIKCKGIGTWDGNSWDSLAIAPFKKTTDSYFVLSISVINNELYFGGVFDSVNNIPCRSFAKWNGSSFSQIGVPSNLFGAVYRRQCRKPYSKMGWE